MYSMKGNYLSWALPKPAPFFICFFPLVQKVSIYLFSNIYFTLKTFRFALKIKKAEWVKRLKKAKSERCLYFINFYKFVNFYFDFFMFIKYDYFIKFFKQKKVTPSHFSCLKNQCSSKEQFVT